jgi:hypothetical protein
MSNAPKRTRAKKPSETVEEKTELNVDEKETKKPIIRKKVSIAETKKEVIKPLLQRFPIIRIKSYQGELRINEDDLEQMWINIKKR